MVFQNLHTLGFLRLATFTGSIAVKAASRPPGRGLAQSPPQAPPQAPPPALAASLGDPLGTRAARDAVLGLLADGPDVPSASQLVISQGGLAYRSVLLLAQGPLAPVLWSNSTAIGGLPGCPSEGCVARPACSTASWQPGSIACRVVQ